MGLAEFKLLTAEEVAEALRVSVKSIYRMARSGALPCVRWGRTVRFAESEVEAFVVRQRNNENPN